MKFITGYIEEYTPKINDIYLVDGNNLGYFPLDVVLDSGFNDEFCLPKPYKDKCKH